MNSKRSNPSSAPAQPVSAAGATTERAVFPHERLDVHQVLAAAYQAVVAWPVSFSKGTTGDQLKRAVGSALLRYTEGCYAQGGCQAAHWVAARASAGEAGAAVLSLVLERRIGAAEAEAVRLLLARAMSMLHRLSRRI